jgi:hypothetical protein
MLGVAALAMSACGSGDGGRQGEVADLFIQLAEEGGIALDRACVEEAAEGLPDEDAEKIAEAGIGDNPVLSDEATAIGDEMFDCVEVDSYIDNVVGQFDNDESVDADCLRDALDGAETPDAVDEQVFDAALACSD